MLHGPPNKHLLLEQVIDTGQEPTLESYWGKLNEGENCSD